MGVTHLMARDKDGTWKEVIDPAIMVKVLNSGETCYRLSAGNPDVRALIDLFNRLCGVSRQAVDVQMGLDDQLLQRLSAWRSRMQGAPHAERETGRS